MLYLIVVTETRNTEYHDGAKWVKSSNSQIVLGTVEADDYEDALVLGANEFGVHINNIDAYELTA